MRLNRGTIILIALGLLVIIGVLVINNQQASAPDTPTPTSEAVVGPVFDELAGNDVARLEIINNSSGDSVVLTQGADRTWQVAAATYATDRATDQDKALKVVGDLVLLQTADRYEGETLANFGLETPSYIVYIDTPAGERHTLYVGNRNPTGNRYYILRESGDTPEALRDEVAALMEAAAETTPEAEATDEPAEAQEAEMSEAEATEEPAAADAETGDEAETTPEPYNPLTLAQATGTILVVPQLAISDLVGLVGSPPYVPPPTATPTATATLNPLSEVEQATQTAIFQATATALFEALETETALTATAAAEVTPEATAAE
jgi:hypothetical protein